MNLSKTECTSCRQPLDPTDRFCRSCGAPVGAIAGFGPFRRPIPTPEQAASYWHSFFRPFFATAFIFFGAFFLAALILMVIWFFMFRT
jgi:cellulose synthase/poly-beta-1,6-N-acetylglucosamine synthase-like glycosyltransferase